MIVSLNFYIDTTKDRLTIEREMTEILRKTADYQHGDITVDSGHGYPNDDYVKAHIYSKDCTDMGHTRNVLNELFQYFREECL